ncbi:hypothetical protein DS901_02640 [Loktanella sp. D2R18]|uniref:RHS repeat-associated core domain-containing protein n=1 Tax=Rhodobacterales TaxID=204455 RepID=UPI000DEA2047|nr:MULTISPECIES: RHS repeat-associated core domain-containing protein [Rhodobacterales]MDO6591948.1 RHS repeat-associated core domain-containing protein [Yoonia sp. 1_MG-2023]RBW45680.1 hypothetical protein DS901_02640 [Loktanella sp. D2R18]
MRRFIGLLLTALALSFSTVATAHDQEGGPGFFSRSSNSYFHREEIGAQCEVSLRIAGPSSAQNMRITDIDIEEHFSANDIRTGTEYLCHGEHDGFGSVIPAGTVAAGGDEYCDREPPEHNGWNVRLGACTPPPTTMQCPISKEDPLGVGNPVSVATGQKHQTIRDWTSFVDPRFNFERRFRDEGLSSYNRSDDGWGRNWFAIWSQRIEIYDTDTRVVHLADGSILHFTGASAAPTDLDHNYTLAVAVVAEAGRHVLTHGSGRKDFYSDKNPEVAVLSEIRWPDGYAISVDYDLNDRPVVVHDNRGQRAEFTWNDTLNSNAIVPVVTQINIDTDYDGATLAADIQINYSYREASLASNSLLMTMTDVQDIASGTSLSTQEFSYDTADLDRLIGISDGRLSDNTYQIGETDLTRALSQVVTATSSSSGWGGTADKVIDGIKGGENWAHTLNGPDEFIQVDLGFELSLTEVVIANRGDSDAERLDGAEVVIYDGSHNEIHRFAPITGATEGTVHTYDLTSLGATRYVAIEHSNQYLHVSEIQVFGDYPEGLVDYDFTLFDDAVTATSSSVYGSYFPEQVLDGDPSSLGVTDNGADEFIQVDLGVERSLTDVVITNREDRYELGYRLDGAEVVIYDGSHSELHRFAPISGSSDGSVHTYDLSSLAAVQYIAIEHSNQYLQVAEIQIFGDYPKPFEPYDYATFAYDTATSRAISTTHFAGADLHQIGLPVDTVDGYSVTTTNPLGKETVYSFEEIAGQDRLVSVEGISTVSCLGSNSTATYDTNGRKLETIERNGARTVLTRDAAGRILTRTEDADGINPRVTTYTWPASDLRKPLTRTTSELSETFTYDADGLMLTYSQTDVLVGSPDLGAVRTWTYTYTTLASGLKVLTSLDGPGLIADGVTDVTTYTYNTRGQLLTTTDANGLMQEVLAYGPSGQPTLVRDHQGFEWALSYDMAGRLLTSTFEPGVLDEVTTYSYDIVGQMTGSVDALGRSWGFTYDEARRLVQTTAPSGETIDFDYDAMGNVIKTEYADAGAIVSYLAETQYDELGRILQAVGSNGQITDFSHDVEDNLSTVTDADSLTTTMSYDALNRMADVVDRANYTTLMDHDDSDQMTSYTDPRGIETGFAFNGFGEMVSETSADRGTMTYVHDNRGLTTQATDGRGIVTNYAYDDGGRLTAKTYSSDATLDQTFTYHADPAQPHNIGGLAYVTDQTGRTDFSNDTLRGGFFEDLREVDGIAYSTTYASNAGGQVTQMDYPSGSQLLFSYDLDGDITGLQWQGYDPLTGTHAAAVDVISAITYKPMGPLNTATYGDGGSLLATYDSSYRLTGLSDTLLGSALRDVSYGWSNRDNLETVTDNLDPTQNELFDYSPREFLASADGAWGELDWLYDGVGNRTQQMSYADAATTTDIYSYPIDSNRLSSISSSTGSTRTLTYDDAGNVTYDNRSGPGYGYNYDDAGRMSSFAINGVIQAEYEYNFLGQQIIRRLTQTGETIHALHDAAGNRIAEYDYDESLGTSTLLREYIWADGMVVAVVEGGALYFVRTDHIGRPIFATDDAGTKVWEASYLPFGGVLTSTGDNSELRFPGQWFQSETALHQNWMRDYDPTTGRYIQADPLGLVDGASVYGYALQNPGRYTDPTGKQSEPGLGDQFNPFGSRDDDNTRNYNDYFNSRFPNTISGAKELFEDRIRNKICLNRLLPTLPGLTGGADDIDISNNMRRFGDAPQGWWERNVKIGNFELRTDDIDITWNCPNCYNYRTNMYVSENTGQNYMLGLFRERRVRMGSWPLNGSGCCAF